MLDILGTVGGNALSLPGILGLALGMMTRNILLATILGGLVGIAETLIFVRFQLAQVEALDLTIAILVGLSAGAVGCLIRIKGATV